MKKPLAKLFTAAVVLAGIHGSAHALTLGTDFLSYAATSIGSVPGLPVNYGGLTVKAGDTSTLLIGGAANGASGLIYEIGVTRDGSNHITGFTGVAAAVGTVGAYNDGGVTYGPGGVLFTLPLAGQ